MINVMYPYYVQPPTPSLPKYNVSSRPSMHSFRHLSENSVKSKIKTYLLKAIVYIKYILEAIKSSSPFFQQYGPLMQEIPKMYKILKAFKQNEGVSIPNESKQATNNVSKPKLYI